ncbi:MAG: hypothetical protein JW954_00475 [Dehalococcoidaceae bacterium]|nr:hypothetical protein [Dehalococcoidaceae bacterium]
MTQNWKEAYGQLEAFVKANPRIRIEHRVTVIPAESREQFYALFDEARQAFVGQKMPTVWNEAHQLSAGYLAAAGKLATVPGVTGVKTAPELDRLLKDPARGLIRPLFNPLFDLLKGKISHEEFEFGAQEAVGLYTGSLLKQGYQKWVILSLAGLVGPDRISAMPWDDIHEHCFELQPDQKRGFTEYSVPRPKDAEMITLGHEGEGPSFLLADIIVHSPQSGLWITLSDDLTDASWAAKNPTTARQWLTLRNKGQDQKPLPYWPDMVAYADPRVENIGLIGDFSSLLRPDAIIECFTSPDWYRQGGLARVRRDRERFQPARGTFIVSRYPVPQEAYGELAPAPAAEADAAEGQAVETPAQDIFILEAGYEAGRLAPILEALMPASPSGEEA